MSPGLWCLAKLFLEWKMFETILMSLAFLFNYLMLNMFRMLVHPSSGACGLFVELFHVVYCSGTMCVGVTVWFGLVVWYPYSG